jgi:flagellar biosynthesis protein FliR
MDMLRALQDILTGLGVHTNVQNFLMLFFLIFTRLASALNLTPFLGGKALPSQVKVGLSVMIAVLLFPGLNKSAGPMPDNFFFYCRWCSSEFKSQALSSIPNEG